MVTNNSDLDQQQYSAVTAPIDKPALVLASAGSGKTRVLQNRCIYLIQQGIAPERIIVTTFTTKAATELKDRIAAIVGKDIASKLACGTIHSICLRLLREKGMTTTVIDDSEQKRFIETALKENKWEIGWQYCLYWINRCKAELISPDDSEQFIINRLINSSCDQHTSIKIAKQMSTVYRVYENEKNNAGYIDFPDMIYNVAWLLQNDIGWRTYLQDRYDAVLIDEAQDNMKLAVEILETIAAPENCIFMCGDDLQTLYQWNMADVENNIFGFLHRYPDANFYKIETNYRSTKKIVEASNKLASFQYSEEKKQYRKFIAPFNIAKDGRNIDIIKCANVSEEAVVVTDWIQTLLDSGKKPEDFYVLYRLNAQSRAIEDQLIQRQIPYVILGSIGFYDRAIVKDIIRYLFLVENKTSDSNDAFTRISNIATMNHSKHYHGFGKTFFEECLSSSTDGSLWQGMCNIKLTTNWYKREGIKDLIFLFNILETQGQHKPLETIRLVRKYAYDNWLMKRDGISMTGDSELFDDLNELENVASKFETNKDLLNYIIRVRKAKEQQKKEGNTNVVTLATVHKVKGLEKPCVALIGMANGILPHWKCFASTANDPLPVDIKTTINDERCIAFVGITRAREELLITYPTEFRNRPVEKSMFLTEAFGE